MIQIFIRHKKFQSYWRKLSQELLILCQFPARFHHHKGGSLSSRSYKAHKQLPEGISSQRKNKNQPTAINFTLAELH